MTGLIIEVDESNDRVRYAFGYKDGKNLAVTKITSSGSAGTIHRVPFSSSDDVVIEYAAMEIDSFLKNLRSRGFGKLFIIWNFSPIGRPCTVEYFQAQRMPVH